MNLERWRQIDPLLQSALDLEPDERRAYLDKACDGDKALRREVEAYLAAHERAGDFLDKSAMEDAAKLAANEQAARETLLNDRDSMNNANPPASSDDLQTNRLPPIAPGLLLDGRYQIVREIGAGGIGTVYLAHDQKLHGAPVVVKVLQDRFRESEHRIWLEKKFQNEIKALERIDHPNVVRALDVGQLADGRSFLVMQYVQGVVLRTVIPPHGMELQRVGKLVHQIAQALSAAHEKGVIHRDLKPENIMLQTASGEEHVKLIDFGIATVRETMTKATTEKTRIAGTIRYMSPEQLKGHPVAASDIYALGVITYELITGRQPFDTDSAVELYERQQIFDLIKLCEFRANLPASMQDVVLKALSFNASDRYAGVGDFSEAFNQALAKLNQQDIFQTTPIASAFRQPAPTMRRRLLPTALLISLLVAAALGTFYWLYISKWVYRPPNAITSSPTLAGIVTPSPTPAAVERSLSISLLGIKNSKHHSDGLPFIPTKDTVFEAGDGIRFIINSSKTGSLYLINERPGLNSVLPRYALLFPYVYANNGLAAIKADRALQIPQPSSQAKNDWFRFNEQKGTEKIVIAHGFEVFRTTLKPNIHAGSSAEVKQVTRMPKT